jgi:hypothetical protein
MGEYPLPTIAELSPKPPSTARVLNIDDALMNSMPVDPFDVARTRKRAVLGTDAAQRLLSVSIVDVTQEVYASELIVESEPAMVAVAPILTPVPFATPYEADPQSSEQVFATEVQAVSSVVPSSRSVRLQLGAFAIASLIAIGGGSAMGIASTPALLRPTSVRTATNDVRTLKKASHVQGHPMMNGVSVTSLPAATPKKAR